MKWWAIIGILGILALGILTTILYFVLSSGDSKGNTINLNKGKKAEGGNKNEEDKQSDTNIIQQTSQGGVHVLETTGQIHIDWKILLSLSILIIIVFLVKWSFEYNLCQLIKCKRFTQIGNKKGKNDKQMKNDKGDQLDLVERGRTIKRGDKQCDRGQNIEGANRARRGPNNMLETENDRIEEVEELNRGGNQDMETFINGILQFIYEFRDMRR